MYESSAMVHQHITSERGGLHCSQLSVGVSEPSESDLAHTPAAEARTHTCTVVGVIPFGSRFPAFYAIVCERERDFCVLSWLELWRMVCGVVACSA